MPQRRRRRAIRLSAHRHLRQLGAAPHCHPLLARSREEEPELEIRVFELPFAAAQGLHNDLLDIGFALSDAVSEGLVAEPVWTDPLSVIVPVRHLCWRTRKCHGWKP